MLSCKEAHLEYRTLVGSSYPLGATWDGSGVNFALFSENAERVELCIFDEPSGAPEVKRLREQTDYVYQVGNSPSSGPSGAGSIATPSVNSGVATPATSRTSPTASPGSSDLYERNGKKPYASINFVSAHDGFTLRDLISYNEKHNEANGEDNRDGSDYNISWNCGVEGETDDPEVLALRARQVRNFMTMLM